MDYEQWTIVIDSLNVVVLALFSYLIWKATNNAARATEEAAKATTRATNLTKLLHEKEEREAEKRNVVSLHKFLESLDKYGKWLDRIKDNPFCGDEDLRPHVYFPSLHTSTPKDTVIIEKFRSEASDFECYYQVRLNQYKYKEIDQKTLTGELLQKIEDLNITINEVKQIIVKLIETYNEPCR